MPKTTQRRGADYAKAYSPVRKGLEADIRRSKIGSTNAKLSPPDRALNRALNKGLGKMHNALYKPTKRGTTY